MNVTNIRLTLNKDENSRYLATASVTIDNAIALNGIRITRRTEDGSLYLLMPATRRRDGTFREPFHPITRDMRETFSRPVLDHFDHVLEDETLSGKPVTIAASDSHLNITDVSIYILPNSTNQVKAIATVTLDGGFVLKGIRILTRSDGSIGITMSSFPRTDAETGQRTWVEHFHPVNNEARIQLQDAVIAAYNKAVADASGVSGKAADENSAPAVE